MQQLQQKKLHWGLNGKPLAKSQAATEPTAQSKKVDRRLLVAIIIFSGLAAGLDPRPQNKKIAARPPTNGHNPRIANLREPGDLSDFLPPNPE